MHFTFCSESCIKGCDEECGFIRSTSAGEFGAFHHLVAEPRLDSDLHLKYFRMNAEQMDELLFSVVGPELTRQIFEQPSNPNSDLQLH